MRINKKILATTIVAPLVIATPMLVATSCGSNSRTKDSVNITPQKNKVITEEEKLNTYSAVPYPKKTIVNVYGAILDSVDFIKELKGELKLQGIKVLDTALVAFLGYLKENDAINSNVNSPSEKSKHEILVKKAKLNFSNNLKKFKIQVDILFDKLATRDGKTFVSEIIEKTSEKQGEDKLNFKADSPLAKVGKLVFKKLKMVIDNVLDTLINIEKPDEPEWKGKAKVKEIGTIKQIMDSKGIPSEFNATEIKQQLISFLNGELVDAYKKRIIRPFAPKSVDLFNYVKVSSILKFLGKSFVSVKPIDQPEIAVQDNGYTAGLKMLKEISKNHPERVKIYQDTDTKNIYFEIDGKTSEFISNLKKNIKYNNKNTGGLINDPLLNNMILTPFMKNGKINLPSKDELLNILKNPTSISRLLTKVDAMLSDFGKAMQFTEINLQSFVSNLAGEKTQYYGALNFNSATHKYTMQKNAFMSPQFNIFKYSNYQSNNRKIKLAIQNHETKDPHLRKTLVVVGKDVPIDIPIIELVDKLTNDPYSNYSISLVELVNSLKLEDITA